MGTLKGGQFFYLQVALSRSSNLLYRGMDRIDYEEEDADTAEKTAVKLGKPEAVMNELTDGITRARTSLHVEDVPRTHG